MFKRIPLLVVILLCLALVGFFQTLLIKPIHILIVIGLSVLLFYLVNNYLKTGRFFPKAGASNRKAVKHSAKQGRMPVKKNSKPARKDFPFQVIEGSKGKNKTDSRDKDSNMS